LGEASIAAADTRCGDGTASVGNRPQPGFVDASSAAEWGSKARAETLEIRAGDGIEWAISDFPYGGFSEPSRLAGMSSRTPAEGECP
jgi:hypothetical protein